MNRRGFIKSGIATIIAMVLPSSKQRPIAKKSKLASYGEHLMSLTPLIYMAGNDGCWDGGQVDDAE